MIWKKTAINSYSKKELLGIIAESIEEHKITITTVEIYTMGTVGTALSELSQNIEIGYKCGITSPRPAMIRSFFKLHEVNIQTSLCTDLAAEKIAKKSRLKYGSSYSVFISEVNKKTNCVVISAVSSLRTYTRVVQLTEDVEQSISQARYFAIYELARLIYNEVNQAIPIEERGRAL